MTYSLGWTLLILAIYVLVAARITALINVDKITNPLRLAIATRATRANRAAIEAESNLQPELSAAFVRKQERWMVAYEFAKCPWCVGFWAALACAVPTVWALGWSWWTILPLGFAASHLIGLGAGLIGGGDDDEIVEKN